MQSDPSVEKGLFRLEVVSTGSFRASFFRQRVDFIVFVLFLEAVGVRECCCMAVGNRLAAMCSFALPE